MLRFDTVFKGVEKIREAQVVQERLDRFVVFVVPAADFSKDDIEKIRANMRLHVGEVEVEVKSVPVIARTPGGKFRAVVSKLSPGEIKAFQIRRPS